MARPAAQPEPDDAGLQGGLPGLRRTHAVSPRIGPLKRGRRGSHELHGASSACSRCYARALTPRSGKPRSAQHVDAGPGTNLASRTVVPCTTSASTWPGASASRTGVAVARPHRAAARVHLGGHRRRDRGRPARRGPPAWRRRAAPPPGPASSRPWTPRWWCRTSPAAALARPRSAPPSAGYSAGAYPANRSNPLFAARAPRGASGAPVRLADRPRRRPVTSSTALALEVYPHPAMVALFGLETVIPYKLKAGRRAARRCVPSYARLLDHLEATCGALLGLPENGRWAQLRAVAAGGAAARASWAGSRTRSTPSCAPTWPGCGSTSGRH